MTKNYREEGTLLIRNSDIKSGKFVFAEKPIHLDEVFAEKNATRRLEIGDVVTVHTGDIGTSAIIRERENGAIGFATINTRPNQKKLNSNYLCTYLNDSKHKNWAVKMSTGDGRNNYNLYDFNRLMIPLPSLAEQAKIGMFFSNTDNLITLHQRKCEKLQFLKRGYLQKIFISKGEFSPKIRFKGFEKKWKRCKVGEIFEVTRGQVLAVIDTSDTKSEDMPYPVYSSQTKNNGLMGYYKDFLFDTAITWTTDGANAGTVNYREGKFYSTNVNGVLLSNKGYANKAIAEILNKEAWKWVSHVGNPKLMNNVMRDIAISIPLTIEEQNKISELCIQFDNLITLHQSKLKKLKLLKQAYLQKMFI